MAWSPVAIQSIFNNLFPPQPCQRLLEALTLGKTDRELASNPAAVPSDPDDSISPPRSIPAYRLRRVAEAELHHRFIEIVRAISEIPLGPSDSLDGLTLLGSATPQVKHLLLADCLSLLGLRYRHVIFTFAWRQQPLQVPKAINQLIGSVCWEEPHHAIEVETVLGNRIVIDISWPSAAERIGLSALPSDWDGVRSFYGVRRGVAVWTGNEGSLAVTKQLRDELPRPARCASSELWAWLFEELSKRPHSLSEGGFSENASSEEGASVEGAWSKFANFS